MKRLPRVQVDYYILNLTVLPPQQNTEEFYSSLIQKVFDKGIRVALNKDFEYQINQFDKFNNGEGYYGQIAKSAIFNDVSWVKKGTNVKIAYSIPEENEARKAIYEFVFYPKEHKFAFIKKGKIEPDVEKKRPVPLKIVAEILRIACNVILEDGDKKAEITIVQSDQIFEKIFENKLTYLDLTVSYSNPGLADDKDETIDKLLREANAGRARLQAKPDSTGQLDTSSTLIKGFLDLAQTDGRVKAKIETPDGTETINTVEHPKISQAVVEKTKDSSVAPKFIRKILDDLKSKFTNGR